MLSVFKAVIDPNTHFRFDIILLRSIRLCDDGYFMRLSRIMIVSLFTLSLLTHGRSITCVCNDIPNCNISVQ